MYFPLHKKKLIEFSPHSTGPRHDNYLTLLNFRRLPHSVTGGAFIEVKNNQSIICYLIREIENYAHLNPEAKA